VSILVVTGTSTDVGKTVVTAALAALAPGPVAVCKPAQTGVGPGEPGDLAEVERLAGPVTTRELARYPDPLAPDTAARRAGLPLLEQDVLTGAVRALDDAHATTIVEGAGGLLVRLGAFTLLDVAVALGAPVVVVAAAGLGTLNHAELTVAALAARGVDCRGVVVGSWPARPGLAERCNLDDLPLVTGVPLLGVVPAGVGRMGGVEFRALAGQWLAPSLGGAWVRTGAPGT
jgi:dethiobiotin synthase